MIVNVLAVHVLLSEVASLVFEYFTIHGKYLREEAYFCLLLQLIAGIAVDEDALPCCVCVQIKKAKKFVPLVEVKDDAFDCVDGRMRLRTGIDVATIEIDAVGIDTVMSTGHPIRIENGEKVKDEAVSQQPCFFSIFSQLVYDACHHVRTRDFTRVHSGSNYECFLI